MAPAFEELDNHVISIIATYARIADYPALRIVLHASCLDRDILNPSLRNIPRHRAKEYVEHHITAENVEDIISVLIDRMIFISRVNKKFDAVMRKKMVDAVETNPQEWLKMNDYSEDMLHSIPMKHWVHTIPLKYVCNYTTNMYDLGGEFGNRFSHQELLLQVIERNPSMCDLWDHLDRYNIINISTVYPELFAKIMEVVHLGNPLEWDQGFGNKNIAAAIIARIIDDDKDLCTFIDPAYNILQIIAAVVAVDNKLELESDPYEDVYCASLATPELIAKISIKAMRDSAKYHHDRIVAYPKNPTLKMLLDNDSD